MIRKALLLAAALMSVAPLFAQRKHRSELTVSYGVAPVSDWIDTYGDMLTGLFTGADTETDGWGAVTVGYNFRLLGNLSVGAQVVYSSNEQKFRRTGDRIDNRYWSVMPNVKWNWLNLRIVTLYSRLGAGATFSKAEAGGHEETATQLAFQVSPIGVAVGGRLAAYAEVGIGTSGCVLVGARYRF